MNQLLTVVLLAGLAGAQTVSSQFVAGERSPSSSSTADVPPVNSSIASTNAVPANNSLPDLLPKPNGNATLLGGTVTKMDRLREELTLKIFGGGSARLLFDSRTHVYRDGSPSTWNTIQDGDRLYADTKLAGKDIFAENIRVVTHGAAGQSIGQVVSYNTRTGELAVSDAIFPRRITLRVPPNTLISRDGKAISADQLVAGTLVSLGFQSGGGNLVAQQITVLAAPGNAFIFVGQVTHLDLHLGSLVIVDPRDGKSYAVNFDPNVIEVNGDLKEGATVEVTANFDGRQYMASAIKLDPPANH